MQASDRDLDRRCFLADGKPKKGYATFDEAFEVVAEGFGQNSTQTHVYRCPEHGYHLGRHRPTSGGSPNGRRAVH